MKRLFFPIFLLTAFLAGCGEAAPVETPLPETTAAIQETVPETTAETEPPAGQLMPRKVSDKVCIGITPDGTGAMQYAILPDQEAAVAAFQQAVNNPYSSEWYIKGDEASGLTVWYQGESWEFMRSGELVSYLGRVKVEEAAGLYSLCAATATDLGWGAVLNFVVDMA